MTVVNSIYEVAPPKMPAPPRSYHPQQSFPSHLPPQGLYRYYIMNFNNVNFGILMKLLFSDMYFYVFPLKLEINFCCFILKKHAVKVRT